MNDMEKRACATCACWRRFADGRGQPIDWWRVPTLSTDHGRRGGKQASVNTPEHLRPGHN